jgi:hypothetical protein
VRKNLHDLAGIPDNHEGPERHGAGPEHGQFYRPVAALYREIGKRKDNNGSAIR